LESPALDNGAAKRLKIKTSDKGSNVQGSEGPRQRFGEITACFRKWLSMTPALEDAVKLACAVAISGAMTDGEPLWLWLVAPPSHGKTEILTSFVRSERCNFQSTVTAAGLISGFRGATDPSLLPKLFNKTLILKEGTEIFAQPAPEREKLFALLRGAYDGRATRSFGNAESRTYEGKFNLLGGVTEIILGRNDSDMGERILRFHIPSPPQRELNERLNAVFVPVISKDREDELCDVCARFLELEPPSYAELLGKINVRTQNRIMALVQIVALLRVKTQRDPYRRDVLYAPSPELGFRLGRQLSKLGGLLAWISESEYLGGRDYLIIQKIALDCCRGWELDIVKAIVSASKTADLNGMMTRYQLAKALGVKTNLYERIDDLVNNGVLMRHEDVRGRNRPMYSLTPHFASLWKQAEIGNLPLKVKVRRKKR
jgi:hypothetical protein